MGHALFPMLDTESNDRHIAFLVDKQNDIRSSKEGIEVFVLKIRIYALSLILVSVLF